MLIDKNIDTTIGLAHTRWSTHGKSNKINAHPHKQGKITIVHNGIIENYKDLKKQLKEYNFKSETDTEILCALIDNIYKEKKDILLRITPGIECHTHDYIQTGQIDSKFGFDLSQIDNAIELNIEPNNQTDAK